MDSVNELSPGDLVAHGHALGMPYAGLCAINSRRKLPTLHHCIESTGSMVLCPGPHTILAGFPYIYIYMNYQRKLCQLCDYGEDTFNS